MAETVRYIIVVHGIGKQRKNETILKVVNRFAESRNPAFSDGLEVLILGRASGQTSKYMEPGRSLQPWVEFEGVPQKPGNTPPPFYGIPSGSGENLRFVDVCWSDIMENDSRDVVIPIEDWAKGLLGRLQRKNAHAKKHNRGLQKVPSWILQSLNKFAVTLILLNKALSFKYKSLQESLLYQMLGDVQQYGEFPRCRGKAVRRFHQLMARVEEEHEKQFHTKENARYTIIAHSLGTVMSMDALFYAHARQSVRLEQERDDFRNLPFEGYLDKAPEDPVDPYDYIYTGWIDRVDSWVTLGSPIDKYLVCWWMNYNYLLDDQWLDKTLQRVTDKTKPDKTIHKIKHYNYCDEQDPVGHEIDILRSVPLYKALFESMEDRVYNRYVAPGLAHLDYWDDKELFARILKHGVDQATPQPNQEGLDTTQPVQEEKLALLNDPFQWFDPKVYKKVLDVSYFMVPIVVILLDFLTLTWAVYTPSWHTVAIATLIFLLTCLVGRKVLDLVIWWRRILREKSANQWVSAKDIPKDNLNPLQKASKDREKDRKKLKPVLVACAVSGFALGLVGLIGFLLGLPTEGGEADFGSMYYGKRLIAIVVVSLCLWTAMVVVRGRMNSPTDKNSVGNTDVFREGEYFHMTGMDIKIILLTLIPALLLIGLYLMVPLEGLSVGTVPSILERFRKLFAEKPVLETMVLCFTLLAYTTGVVFSYTYSRYKEAKDFFEAKENRVEENKIKFPEYVG